VYATPRQTGGLSRRTLLSRGARTAAALGVGGTVFSRLTPSARAEALPEEDLAHLRVVIAAELLAIDFYRTAAAAKRFSAGAAANLRRALADERTHYAALAQALRAAGESPTVAGEIDFVYPARSFATRASIARLAVRLEGIFVGVALGAAAHVQAPALRLQVAQIAASESRHLASAAILAGRSPIGGAAFPGALSLEAATNALGAFES